MITSLDLRCTEWGALCFDEALLSYWYFKVYLGTWYWSFLSAFSVWEHCQMVFDFFFWLTGTSHRTYTTVRVLNHLLVCCSKGYMEGSLYKSPTIWLPKKLVLTVKPRKLSARGSSGELLSNYLKNLKKSSCHRSSLNMF